MSRDARQEVWRKEREERIKKEDGQVKSKTKSDSASGAGGQSLCLNGETQFRAGRGFAHGAWWLA